ncbi:MAG: hypothetical protein QM529_07625, partial [Hydrotalea sp.]|nr:hypothetical protein [Hydrotalea sp.]
MLNNMVTYGARVGRRFAGSLLAAGAIFGLPAIGQAQGAGSGNNGASPSSSGAVGQNLLANSVAGKLMLKADVGYVYSFSGTWNKSTAEKPSIGGNTSVATGGVGYGVSLGWTHKSGFGIAGDYLGFEHKWTGGGTDVTKPNNQYNYDAIYHVLTVTPNYRFKLDAADRWGLRLGLGVGVSISDITWARKLDTANNAQAKNGTKVAGGAVFYNKNKTDITGTT